MKIFAFDFGKKSQVPNGMANLDTLLDEASNSPISGQRVNYGDKLLYIYTSGTTGLPKAVRDGKYSLRKVLNLIIFVFSLIKWYLGCHSPLTVRNNLY